MGFMTEFERNCVFFFFCDWLVYLVDFSFCRYQLILIFVGLYLLGGWGFFACMLVCPVLWLVCFLDLLVVYYWHFS